MKKIVLVVAAVVVLAVVVFAGRGLLSGRNIYKDENVVFAYPKGWQGSSRTDFMFYPPQIGVEGEGMKSRISLRVDDMMAEKVAINITPEKIKKGLAQRIPDVSFLAETSTTVSGKKGYRVVIAGSFRKVPIKGIGIFVAKGAKLYSITYTSPIGSFEKDLKEFDKFLKSIKF
jgi:hypothetical protein